MLDSSFWKKYFLVYDSLNELIPYQRLIQMIIKQLDIKPGQRILDVGSGTGNIATQVKQHGGQVFGIDISAEGVALHSRKDPTAILKVADISNPLPYPDAYFDRVYSNNTLYTIPRDTRSTVFAEMYRVLKPGGRIVISNLRDGFRPLSIYKDHIRISIKEMGMFHTCLSLCKFMYPTINIFYYNYLIKKENDGGSYDFFHNEEQAKEMNVAGFSTVTKDVEVYSGQAILNTGKK